MLISDKIMSLYRYFKNLCTTTVTTNIVVSRCRSFNKSSKRCMHGCKKSNVKKYEKCPFVLDSKFGVLQTQCKCYK